MLSHTDPVFTFGLSVFVLTASGSSVLARLSRTGPAIGWERIIQRNLNNE